MELVYILAAVVALVAAYFLFLKKPADSMGDRKLADADDRSLEDGSKALPRSQLEADGPKPEDLQEEAPPESGVDVAVGDGEEQAEAPEPPAVEASVDVATLRKGLSKARENEGFFGRLQALLGGKKDIDAGLAEEIEEVLLTSDVGVGTTETILARLKAGLEKGELNDPARVWEALHEEAIRILDVEGHHGKLRLSTKPTVVLMVGVNGAGKTTTIGKLATQLTAEGTSCVLAAADTFRAAAVQQLEVWGERVGCAVVRGKDGADPGSVVFEAIKKAQELKAGVVLADTAGRLHTKTNLMGQMTKIAKTAGKALEGAPHEVLLVLDATNGQNALAQAREFKQALNVTGIILTKLDGTAKGGVVLGVCDALKIPVRYIGLGERPDDLHPFSPEAFVTALLGEET